MQQRNSKRWRGSLRLMISTALAIILCALPTAASALSVNQGGREQRIFAEAAQEFGIPKEILLAVSYYQSRWEDHDGQMSVDGGYGPMNLRTEVPVEDGRGDPARPIRDKKFAPKGERTLDKAAQLLHRSHAELREDMRQNIRGGAAVLADQAKTLYGGQLPSNLSDWYPVAGAYLGGTDPQQIALFVDELHTTLREGKTAITTDGQQLTLPAQPEVTAPQPQQLQDLGLVPEGTPSLLKKNANGAECPKAIDCRFVPAGYAANSADPADYGNYDHANRPQDMKVNYIVIHDTEGSYASAISHFQDTKSYVSAHYVIRSSDGAVTQMVPTSGVAWHAGDWYMNMHSIGIEHEGEAAAGASWYTEAMYQSSARLVRYLAKKYDIPLDREHIIGHDNIPGLKDSKAAVMHWDPGPYWDWNHYMSLVTGEPAAAPRWGGGHRKNAVTITPAMATNQQTVTVCAAPTDPATCLPQTANSNFVYLRSEPRNDAPLLKDPLLHPGGEPGSNRIDDWTAKATTGQRYALAEEQGDWTAIWFANQKGWFYNPASARTASKIKAQTVTLRPGLSTTHVYGGAYPEATVYPADVPGPVQPALSYTISAGQAYVTAGTVPTDYFYDATIDYSKPHDHEIFTGQDTYLQIWYNQRVMFVKASDVIVRN